MKIKVAVFDTKSYDTKFFDELRDDTFEITYFEHKLNKETVRSTAGYDVVVPFVNDTIDKATIDGLVENNVKLISMRCAGFNNIDLNYAYGKIKMTRVPWYSPYAVAEHAMALLLCVNRRIPRAFIRTRDYNFSLEGLIGWDLHGKTAGVIGTGKIGKIFIDICNGFGMKVIAYDPYPMSDSNINYVPLDKLFAESDVISLHCPLTDETNRIINKENISKMKTGITIINTSRGGLVNSHDLLEALLERKVKAAALDVYEEEADIFFEDLSDSIMDDEVLARLVSLPNVIITSHQAFLTREALENIALVTFENIRKCFNGEELENEIKP